MLFPILCFTCGMPIQQHQKRYYELVDKYTTEKSIYLARPTTENLINELKRKFSSINSAKSFEENVIFYYNQQNDPSVKELAEKYRYTPEFRAIADICIPNKMYCGRLMFICQPRDLSNVIV